MDYDDWKSTEIKHETLTGMVCDECGERLVASESYYELGGIYCKDCMDRHIHYADERLDCAVCGKPIEENEMYAELYGIYICKKCLGIAGRVAI